MKTLLHFLLLVQLSMISMLGQQYVRTGTVLPKRCSSSVPELFDLRAGGDSDGLYICRNGAWEQIKGVSSGGGAGASGKDYVAAKCQSGIAAAAFSLPVAGAPVAACVTGTDSPVTVMGVVQFTDDTTTVISVQDHFMLPAVVPTSVSFSGKWRSAVADETKSAVWQLRTKCVANGAAVSDISWNAAQEIVDTNRASADQENDFSLSAVAMTGCTGGDELHWILLRDPAHASDTLEATAELISLRFSFN